MVPGDPEVASLNRLQEEIPSPWDTVRLDAFTYRFAKAYLAAERPRVLYLALSEPHDFAHDGFYDQYAAAAARADGFIADLWDWLQHVSDSKPAFTGMPDLAASMMYEKTSQEANAAARPANAGIVFNHSSTVRLGLAILSLLAMRGSATPVRISL